MALCVVHCAEAVERGFSKRSTAYGEEPTVSAAGGFPSRLARSCRKIAITLIDAEKGKAKAQACVIACLRQLHPFRFFVLD
jgi:hypothetical protein